MLNCNRENGTIERPGDSISIELPIPQEKIPCLYKLTHRLQPVHKALDATQRLLDFFVGRGIRCAAESLAAGAK